MRLGTSGEPDSALAAQNAVEEALAGETAALVILFVSPTYDMQSVATSANAAAGAP